MAKPREVKMTVNFWAAIQNIATHSMNKGQFPLACTAGLAALLIFKLPPEDAASLLDHLLTNLTKWKGVSYTLNPVLVFGWAFHARWQRRSMNSEMDRIGREKTRLQEQITGLKLSSSSKAITAKNQKS